MRRAVLVIAVAACGSSPPGPSPVTPIANIAPPVIANKARPCREAAVGLEQGTRDLRAPDTSILDAMNERCRDDLWPTAAITCFASMQPDDLAKCADELPEAARNALFDQIVNGSNDPRAAIAVATIRLAGLKVGVALCDQFVAAVGGLMRCETMPIEDRVQLGTLTLDAWSVPNHGLPPDAERRMTEACKLAILQLQQRAATAGCAP